MLGFFSALGFFGLGEGSVALGQCGQLGVQVGHVLVGRIAAVAHGLPVGFALGIRQKNGRDTLDGVLLAEHFVLFDFLRGLLGLITRAVELEQDEILRCSGLERFL